ncbi:uncharacterized protein LOC111611064 [Xiphophorus maculatus]|uniref:uncharacterized protein LOC111611064 n=1 Tax=Xiphophorus maculatus TaxID=8083 RepID=UPI000C6D00BF|nr:uncharacterized protein LOC111611064 [Xiphophorus maculatus]
MKRPIQAVKIHNGSIVNNIDLEFATASAPNNTQIVDVLVKAVSNITVFVIDKGSIVVDVTYPENANDFKASSQDETSITLQWNKINNNISFVLQFNGTETSISAPNGYGPVNHTVSSLSPGTKYTFTLFSVFNNIRSSGVQLAAATAPKNADGFRASNQSETSITLQWNKINNNISFVLQFNGTETSISAPDGYGPVNHTVSSLNPGTNYTFTLFSVFNNIRSSGVQLTAATAPKNADGFRASNQSETSITLQWNKINNNISFVLQFNGTETSISAPDGYGPVNHTVSSLNPGTNYTFTLFSVFNNIRSSGVQLTAANAPKNADGFRASNQSETSITLQWNKINNNISFVLQFNGTETSISAPDGYGPVNHTVSSLSPGTKYTFTLFSVFNNIRSSGVQLTAATAPKNADGFRASNQSETSITLQWNKINNNISFVLQFNGTETSISAPDGYGPVNHTVSSLSPGTNYTFTLFSVFNNIRSSGVQLAAATAPKNADGFRASNQSETSITLQWNKINNNISFVLQFNGTETSISAPDGYGPVNHTVSSLNPGTNYTFTLFSVFNNIRSSGVQLTAATAPKNADGFRASNQSETSITLQWNKINNNISFVLQFNGTETSISAPDGYGPVNHTVSSLSPGTKYTFTLFSVFNNIRSSGVQLTAATAPKNADGFRASNQSETSITLQWNKINNNISFVLQFNGTETSISAPDGYGPVNHTVSSLSPGTNYTFTLFSVFNNIRSSGVQLAAATAPKNADGFGASSQDETSIILQWNKINNNISFVLQFNGTETSISAPNGYGPVNHTVSSLSPGTKYTFTLFSVFNNIRSSGVQLTAATAPENADGFRASSQDETSITLQWNKINNNISFVLQFNGTETSISAPDGYGPVNHTVSSLSPGTKYTFTLFSVFNNIRSSGVQLTAATAPKNADGFRASNQSETSITLQWNKINNNISFVLQFNGTETSISAPDGYGPVNHTVSSLSPRTNYTFTLFSVFDNIRSRGVQLTAATAPKNANGFRASSQDETSITLQWNKINNNISFVLQFNGTETFISAPDGDGPVNHIVSSLSPGTKYTFTLFSVFNNIRSSGVSITAATIQIRLAGAGLPRCSGRVEVYQNSTWGTVCDDNWDLNNANVVCRELGCGTAVTATIGSIFGQGTGQIWLNDVSCSGNEASLTQCQHGGFGTRDCGHCEDAGVVCSDQIRLAGDGFSRCSGRVEVYHNRIWGTVCDDDWDLSDANVVCRELDCGTAVNATIGAFFGQGTGQIWFNDVSCSGYETSLTQCQHRRFGRHNCGHSKDAGVICSELENADGFKASSQDETSITLQWNKINNNISFVLQFNCTETSISAPDGDGPVNHTVSSLSPGTKYTFTLFSVFENIRSGGVQLTAATAPENANGFRASSQDETSITLQWNKINNNISFVLQFKGTETSISAPDGDGPVNHIVTSLSPGTNYTFTLFSVFNNIRSSGVQLTAATAPENAKGFRASSQDETSITLQWNKINNNISFVLQFNGTETFISAPNGDGPVNHIVSSLSPGTKYTFTLFSVFNNIRSSGVQLAAATGSRATCGQSSRVCKCTLVSDSCKQTSRSSLLKQQDFTRVASFTSVDDPLTRDLLNSSVTFSNMSSLIKTQLEPFFQKKFSSVFLSMEVSTISKSSLVHTMNLKFRGMSVPDDNEIRDVLMEAASSVVDFSIETKSISILGKT